MKFRYDVSTEKLVITDSSRIEYHQINLWLTRFVKGYRYMPHFKMGVWNGKETYFNEGSVNMGLWKECLKACKEIGTNFVIENKEQFPINRDITLESVTDFCNTFFKNHKIKDEKTGEWISFMPYDYQIETAFKILKNRYCMTEVATSGGKSLIISIVTFYILEKIKPDAKFLIVVPSISLVTQFYDGIIEYYYGKNNLEGMHDHVIQIEYNDGNIITKAPNELITVKNKVIKAKDLSVKKDSSINKITKIKIDIPLKIQEIMSDKPRNYEGVDEPNIYIGCYQSLEKWPAKFFKQFHTVAVDEAHLAKAATIKSIMTRTFGHAYNRYGVSGTFPSEDSYEILTIQSILGPIVTQIEASTLVKSGTITPMEIKAIILNHDNILINDRITLIRKSGSGAEAFRFEKDFIQQSELRINFIKKLVNKFNNNALLLFNTLEYGTKLYDILKETYPDKEFYYIDGTINNKDREEIKRNMELTDGKVRILLGSFLTFGTGVSVKNIFNIVFLDSYKSEQIVIQGIGRGLRLFDGKTKLNVFDIVDVFDVKKMNNILYKHYLERQQMYINRKYPYSEIKINL